MYFLTGTCSWSLCKKMVGCRSWSLTSSTLGSALWLMWAFSLLILLLLKYIEGITDLSTRWFHIFTGGACGMLAEAKTSRSWWRTQHYVGISRVTPRKTRKLALPGKLLLKRWVKKRRDYKSIGNSRRANWRWDFADRFCERHHVR